MKKIIGLLLIFILTIAWVVITSLHFYGLNSVQKIAAYHNGLLSLTELSADPAVSIATDAYQSKVCIDSLHIPHVFAKDDSSLAYATGYIHARDRYFQMEMLVHTVQGRMSEIVGGQGFNSDMLWRSFDLESKAATIIDSLSRVQPDLVSFLRCYARGVNDYLNNEGKHQRDPMYLVWGYSPEPWQLHYSLLIQWYMAFNLTFSDNFINRQELLDKLPDSVMQSVFPTMPDSGMMIMPIREKSRQIDFPQQAIVKLFNNNRINNYTTMPSNRSIGSNNWVVGGSRTKEGQAFLCNDLHLFLTNPNIFYEMELSSPGMHVYGYTVPGVPFVVTGHNEQIAWGITNGGWDVTEQYLLKVNPSDQDMYWLDNKWEHFKTQQYRINIKGKGTVNHTVKYSVFGPVIYRDSLVIASRWHPAIWNSTVQAFWKLSRAGNWNEFRESLRYYQYPSQNFAYADIKGNIGMISAGKMPVKPLHYSGGLMDGTHDCIKEYIPFDSLPYSYNSQKGYLYSANQEPERGRYYYSSRWFSDLYRPRRIDEILSRNDIKPGFEEMRNMQKDVTDLSSKDIRQLLFIYTDTGKLSADWKMMLNWNGEILNNRHAIQFYRAFRDAGENGSKELAGVLGVKTWPTYDQFINFLLRNKSVSYRDKIISSREIFEKLMKETDLMFSRYYNYPGIQGDTLNTANNYSFSIPQMTFLPGFDIPVSGVGGSDNTINVNNRNVHPVIRTVIEIRDGHINSWMINAVGQTGRVSERDYRQQLQSWKSNDLHKTQFVRSPETLHGISQVISISKK